MQATAYSLRAYATEPPDKSGGYEWMDVNLVLTLDDYEFTTGSSKAEGRMTKADGGNAIALRDATRHRRSRRA